MNNKKDAGEDRLEDSGEDRIGQNEADGGPDECGARHRHRRSDSNVPKTELKQFM